VATITAKGMLGDTEATIVCKEEKNNIAVYIDGHKDHLIKNMLDSLVAIAPPMGGTYYPEADTIEVEGEIEPIPYEDGVIY